MYVKFLRYSAGEAGLPDHSLFSHYPIGVTRDEVVYELFFTALPQSAFTPADAVDLYLHRGSFETVLADEDKEQDPDRWCSHTGGVASMLASRQPMDVESARFHWGIASIRHPCARPNLLLPSHSPFPRPFPTNPLAWPTALRSSRGQHRWEALPATHSLSTLMAPCAVLPGTPSMHKNGAPNARVLTPVYNWLFQLFGEADVIF